MGRDVVDALHLSDAKPVELAREWGVRRLGEKLSIRTRGGQEKAVVADVLPRLRRRRRSARRADAAARAERRHLAPVAGAVLVLVATRPPRCGAASSSATRAVPAAEMRAVMLPFVSVHQIEAPIAFRRETVSGAGWSNALCAPAEMTAQCGWIASSSSLTEPNFEP